MIVFGIAQRIRLADQAEAVALNIVFRKLHIDAVQVLGGGGAGAGLGVVVDDQESAAGFQGRCDL